MKEKIFYFSNLRKKSAWKRVLYPENLINLVTATVLLLVGGYDHFFNDNCVFIGQVMFYASLAMLCLFLLIIVCNKDDRLPSLWDINFINRQNQQ